jgi:hypothetical protein
MTQRTLGLIMNGVSGRMGVNQHLIRSVAAIRAQGGVAMSDGSRVMLDPVLVGRSAGKVKALAERHGGLRWTTDLDAENKPSPPASTSIARSRSPPISPRR